METYRDDRSIREGIVGFTFEVNVRWLVTAGPDNR